MVIEIVVICFIVSFSTTERLVILALDQLLICMTTVIINKGDKNILTQ